MNLLIYLVLTTILLLSMGLPSTKVTRTVAQVSKCLAPANATRAQIKACTQTNTPAAQAGLKAGDQIVAVNGTRIRSWDQLVSIIQPAAGRKLRLTVDRHGTELTKTITPVRNLKCANDTCTKTIKAGFLGIAPVQREYFAHQSILDVPGQIGSQISVGLHAIGNYPAKLHSLWQTVFDGKPRDPTGAVGVVGISRIGGEIADSHRIGWEDKLYSLIGLLASVNLLLFFFNLLPLLPLDGGHVAGALVESVKRGRARLRHRAARGRDPSAEPAHRQIFVDTAQMLPVMYAVASVLVLVTLLTLYADIVKPINVG